MNILHEISVNESYPYFLEKLFMENSYVYILFHCIVLLTKRNSKIKLRNICMKYMDKRDNFEVYV